jgi:hypothetical protein
MQVVSRAPLTQRELEGHVLWLDGCWVGPVTTLQTAKKRLLQHTCDRDLGCQLMPTDQLLLTVVRLGQGEPAQTEYEEVVYTEEVEVVVKPLTLRGVAEDTVAFVRHTNLGRLAGGAALVLVVGTFALACYRYWQGFQSARAQRQRQVSAVAAAAAARSAPLCSALLCSVVASCKGEQEMMGDFNSLCGELRLPRLPSWHSGQPE